MRIVKRLNYNRYQSHESLSDLKFNDTVGWYDINYYNSYEIWGIYPSRNWWPLLYGQWFTSYFCQIIKIYFISCSGVANRSIEFGFHRKPTKSDEIWPVLRLKVQWSDRNYLDLTGFDRDGCTLVSEPYVSCHDEVVEKLYWHRPNKKIS
jgi:hypothetical protein